MLDENVKRQKTANSILEASNSELRQQLKDESCKRKREKDEHQRSSEEQKREFQRQIEERDRQVAKSGTRQEALQQLLSRKIMRIQERDKQIVVLGEAIVGHKSEKEELRQQLDKQSTTTYEHDKRVAALQDDIARHTDETDGLRQELHQRDKQLSGLTGDIADLQRQLSQQTESVACQKKEKDVLRQHLSRQILSQLPDCSTLARDYIRRRLEQDDPKFAALRDCFLQSMTSHRLHYKSDHFCQVPDVEITNIDEVVHPTKQKAYDAARSGEVLQRNPHGCSVIQGIKAFKCAAEAGCLDFNEYLLFHGCPWHRVDEIARRGIDPQRGGEAVGSMFGRGAYFAQNASKSNLYTNCSECQRSATFQGCRHAEGERCVIAVRVILGETKMATTEDYSQIIRAPDRISGEPFESISAVTKENGGKVDHMEFVIFDRQLALVRYLIFYRHKRQCCCHNCRHRRQQS